MSKRNLATVTCLLAQNDLVDFIEEYGIPWCYDPKLPKSGQTALNALDGYIPLYMSLFSIGNLRFPLNNFSLDVFEFFRCHFLLLNHFGVARVTTFAVSCKAYGGKATMPLFRAFLTLRAACDWITFQKRPGSKILALSAKAPLPLSTLQSHLIRICRVIFHHILEAQTFPKPVMYLAEMAFRNFTKKPGQSPSFSGKSVAVLELTVVGESVLVIKKMIDYHLFDVVVEFHSDHYIEPTEFEDSSDG
nr:hypothetical protein [Tanacetum cinerariifolium]